MWLCEGKLKVKTANFRLPSASQKRACLSSLVVLAADDCSESYYQNLNAVWFGKKKVTRDAVRENFTVQNILCYYIILFLFCRFENAKFYMQAIKIGL